MGLLLCKITLTPLFIAAATLCARRWGPVLGGWIVGLPLTSGPVSVFLALEQGRDFAAQAAASTILGTLNLAAYAILYARLAKHLPWFLTLPLSLTGYFILIALFSTLALAPIPATLLALAFLFTAMHFEKTAATKPATAPPHWWDIPFRMAAATAVVLTITLLSSHLGPQLSGLLSAFPVIITVMYVFSHNLYGPEIVHQLTYGLITGSFAFLAFFLIVAATVRSTNLALVYLLATAATCAVNLFILYLTKQKRHTR